MCDIVNMDKAKNTSCDLSDLRQIATSASRLAFIPIKIEFISRLLCCVMYRASLGHNLLSLYRLLRCLRFTWYSNKRKYIFGKVDIANDVANFLFVYMVRIRFFKIALGNLSRHN